MPSSTASRKRTPRRGTVAVGLTGGIASGKTVVASEFARQGAIVISADDEAKALLGGDPAVVRRVRKLLGDAAYSADGTPDRAFIARRIFSSDRKRRALNAILHPAVIASNRRAIAEARRGGTAPMVVVEAALIYEARMERLFDVIVVVDAPVRERVERIVRRNGVSKAEALRRIRAQGDSARKSARADIVIRNRGALGDLRRSARWVFRFLARFSGR